MFNLNPAPENARTYMAEGSDYDPIQDGLLTLTPDPDDITFGRESESMNAKGTFIGKQSSGGLFGFTFSINDFTRKFISDAMAYGADLAKTASNHYHEPSKSQKRRLAGDESMFSTLLGTKRKPSDHDLQAEDCATARMKKARVGNYVLANNRESLIHSDPNTNSNSQVVRGPRLYTWGTSKVRRSYRSIPSEIAVKFGFPMGVPLSVLPPTNELNFDKQTFMVHYPDSFDMDMCGA